MIIGIDASNIRAGGGLTHLSQLLTASGLKDNGVEKIIVWAGRSTLQHLPTHIEYVELEHVPMIDGALPKRVLWQLWHLPRLAKTAKIDMLFSPGGTFVPNKPCSFITMSQNLLPFDRQESRRFEFAKRLRYDLLRFIQSKSFLKADGVIFLSDYAREKVLEQLPRSLHHTAVIAHGIDTRFRLPPRSQKNISSYSFNQPFRLLYVSIVNLYKHQWNVATAVGQLRKKGLPVAIDFVGPAYKPAVDQLNQVMKRDDPNSTYMRFLGPVPYADLHRIYHEADSFVFASSCENLPNILLEAMAAGLPIACSNRSAMPEILGDAGLYFDPEQADDIAQVLYALIHDPDRRKTLANMAYKQALQFTWERCAHETFSFFFEMTGQPKLDA